MPYLSASAVVIHYEGVLYQVYGPLPFTFSEAKDNGSDGTTGEWLTTTGISSVLSMDSEWKP